jgi:hypothetical protein
VKPKGTTFCLEEQALLTARIYERHVFVVVSACHDSCLKLLFAGTNMEQGSEWEIPLLT